MRAQKASPSRQDVVKFVTLTSLNPSVDLLHHSRRASTPLLPGIGFSSFPFFSLGTVFGLSCVFIVVAVRFKQLGVVGRRCVDTVQCASGHSEMDTGARPCKEQASPTVSGDESLLGAGRRTIACTLGPVDKQPWQGG